MLRDAKRRQTAKDYAQVRVRLMAMKRNDILPIELRVSFQCFFYYLFIEKTHNNYKLHHQQFIHYFN